MVKLHFNFFITEICATGYNFIREIISASWEAKYM